MQQVICYAVRRSYFAVSRAQHLAETAFLRNSRREASSATRDFPRGTNVSRPVFAVAGIRI